MTSSAVELAPASPLAIVAGDGQIFVVWPGKAAPQQVTWSRKLGGLLALAGVEAPDSCAWPCWSPDGTWLAGLRGNGQGTDKSSDDASTVFVAQVDGVEERELFWRRGEHPIYTQWSPDGRSLGLLCQRETELLLYLVGIEGGDIRLVDSGVPLFFAWTESSGRMMVHAGAPRRRARLVCRAVGSHGEDAVFAARPGSFCTPLLVPGNPPQVVFAIQAEGDRSNICASNLDGSKIRHIASLRGLLAIVPDREGRRVAIAGAPGGEGSPYEGLWLADLAGGPLVQVSTHALMAFFWCAGGRRLVYAALDKAAGCARWYRCDLGTDDPSDAVEQELGPFWPTRDQLFHFHFFEQFSASHLNIDPSGRWLCWASHAPPTSKDPRRRPWIMIMDLDSADPEPRPVMPGSYAVFRPELTTA